MTMNAITVLLLCALANRVMSQTNDTSNAKILASQKTLSENSELYLTCSTFGLKKHTDGFIYLCKDGHIFQSVNQRGDQYDSRFTISKVSISHSGNYSCFYSKNANLHVAMRGSNIIQIRVIANFLPADISVTGPSTITEGDDVKFRCFVSHALQTFDECQLIQSYLRKNETILQMQAFNVSRMETTFTIGGAVMRDSGHYSCVLMPSTCIRENDGRLHGNNAVFVEVKEKLVFRVLASCAMIIQMLLLALCMWWINKQGCCTASGNKREDGQQVNTGFEEEEQTQGVDLEGHEDFFSSSEESEGSEEWPQNGVVIVEPSCEPLYNNIDDEPACPIEECWYATSLRRADTTHTAEVRQ